ncbi:hypothetical protein [Tenacibaculum caenipelagi]|uniref:Lipoprotein n=1 Tax=Tenacibaculum caenipelagi TaxID=1325435 RepID=A0A4R6TED3_9FLAO|nr:hypothetical protein [Tenacibaculum caenipelagi]TDQ25466.1 hypothetical protein DFQ07_1888 [Tenacibaculum caenipelagi]
MKGKILSLLIIISLVSCNKYSREKYPQFATKTESYKYVNSCYSVEFDNLNKIPIDIQNQFTSYLKNRLGINNFQKLEFKFGYALSDKPIEIERTKSESEILAILGQNKEKSDCDSIINFPVYSIIYELKLPEIGIDKVGINLMLDTNGKPIKDVDFPKAEFADKLIPIDSVHSELIRRKIPYKKLNIDLWFDKRIESFVWSTSTLIREGSIFGPSCFPEVKYHFKINANNGEITEFNNVQTSDYFFGSDNHYVE